MDSETLFWAPHPTEVWVPGRVVDSTETTLRLEDNDGSIVEVQRSQTSAINSLSLTGCANLLDLGEFSMSCLLHNIRTRYSRSQYYSSIGLPILISVNPYCPQPRLYGEEVRQKYVSGVFEAASNDDSEGKNDGQSGIILDPSVNPEYLRRPHLFATAQMTYSALVRTGMAQSIVISGESGAGKTEATKILLKYFSDLCVVGSGSGSGSGVKEKSKSESIEEHTLRSNPILEAFGNAKTVRNDNSSRFGKFIQIYFEASGRRVKHARVCHYLLEKCRLVGVHPGERNFHVFYLLLRGGKALVDSVQALSDREVSQLTLSKDSKDSKDCPEMPQNENQNTQNTTQKASEGVKLEDLRPELGHLGFDYPSLPLSLQIGLSLDGWGLSDTSKFHSSLGSDPKHWAINHPSSPPLDPSTTPEMSQKGQTLAFIAQKCPKLNSSVLLEASQFCELVDSLYSIGFSSNDIIDAFKIIGGLLHFRTVEFESDANASFKGAQCKVVVGEESLAYSAMLWGIGSGGGTGGAPNGNGLAIVGSEAESECSSSQSPTQRISSGAQTERGVHKMSQTSADISPNGGRKSVSEGIKGDMSQYPLLQKLCPSSPFISTEHLTPLSVEAHTCANSTSVGELMDLLLFKFVWDAESGGSWIKSGREKPQCEYIRDSIAKDMYSRLFDWLINRINVALRGSEDLVTPPPMSHTTVKAQRYNSMTSLSKPTGVSEPIGLLDIYGFEVFDGRNSFEQLCINYANEKLQQHFNQHCLALEQQTYRMEGVDWSNVEWKDNGDIIRALDDAPNGVFVMLNDMRVNTNKNRDSILLNNIARVSRQNVIVDGEPIVCMPDRRLHLSNTFTVNHYAGPVSYNVVGFCEKNVDTLENQCAAFFTARTSNPTTTESIMLGRVDPSHALAGIYQAAISAADVKRNTLSHTVSTEFRYQLDSLLSSLTLTTPTYVRCIKPNGHKSPVLFNSKDVLRQLEYAGLLESIRIRNCGYGIRMSFREFIVNYWPLCPSVAMGGVADDMGSPSAHSNFNSISPLKLFSKVEKAIHSTLSKHMHHPDVKTVSTASLLCGPTATGDLILATQQLIQTSIRREYGQLVGRKPGSTSVSEASNLDLTACFKIGKSKVFLKEELQQVLEKQKEILRRTSAERIQSHWRGFVARKMVKRVSQRVIQLQSVWRSHRARVQTQLKLSKVKIIQTVVRHLQKQQFRIDQTVQEYHALLEANKRQQALELAEKEEAKRLAELAEIAKTQPLPPPPPSTEPPKSDDVSESFTDPHPPIPPIQLSRSEVDTPTMNVDNRGLFPTTTGNGVGGGVGNGAGGGRFVSQIPSIPSNPPFYPFQPPQMSQMSPHYPIHYPQNVPNGAPNGQNVPNMYSQHPHYTQYGPIPPPSDTTNFGHFEGGEEGQRPLTPTNYNYYNPQNPHLDPNLTLFSPNLGHFSPHTPFPPPSGAHYPPLYPPVTPPNGPVYLPSPPPPPPQREPLTSTITDLSSILVKSDNETRKLRADNVKLRKEMQNNSRLLQTKDKLIADFENKLKRTEVKHAHQTDSLMDQVDTLMTFNETIRINAETIQHVGFEVLDFLYDRRRESEIQRPDVKYIQSKMVTINELISRLLGMFNNPLIPNPPLTTSSFPPPTSQNVPKREGVTPSDSPSSHSNGQNDPNMELMPLQTPQNVPNPPKSGPKMSQNVPNGSTFGGIGGYWRGSGNNMIPNLNPNPLRRLPNTITQTRQFDNESDSDANLE